ncbi:MAG: hypothetical protein ACK5NC_04840 [Vibrio sp.]
MDSKEPSIPRDSLPYRMVKRIAILERDCPQSKTVVEDSVIIFYDKLGAAAPIIAMHADDLLKALENHFK